MRTGKKAAPLVFAAFLLLLGSLAFFFLAPRGGTALQKQMRRMAVLDNGRLMPLDSFARNLLRQLNGRDTASGRQAIDWLARLVFTPERVLDEPVFRIQNAEVRTALGLADRGRFSFAELSERFDLLQRLARSAAEFSAAAAPPANRHIVQLYSHYVLYSRLAASLRLLVPLETLSFQDRQLKNALGLPAERRYFSYLDLAPHLPWLKQMAETAKAKRPESLGPQEKELALLVAGMERLKESYSSGVLAVIPPGQKSETAWSSPWEIAAAATADPEAISMLRQLESAAAGYYEGNEDGAAEMLRHFNDSVRRRAAGRMSEGRIGLELLYNRLSPFFIATLLYAAAFILLMVYHVTGSRLVYRSSLGLLAAGLLPHTAGILLRMLISGRPPVTNLYETLVFVSWTAAAAGTMIELLQRKTLGVTAGSFAGFMFLLITSRFTLEGDTMGMLQAVLNTNLWLAVHVTTVTMGYGGCVVAGIIGHVYVIRSLRRRSAAGTLDHAYHSLYATLAFGLVFTFAGTVMGGIWADQSWGRFWGWDPKENGALLIILWLAIIFHARRAGMIGPFGMAWGSIVLIITVVLAWFGVNLLNVGMHSYGFTSGVNYALMALVAAEIMFLAAAAWLHHRKSAP